MLGKGIEGLIFSVPVFQDHSCSPCSFILGAPHCVLRNLCATWCNLRRQYKLVWMSNLFHMRPNSRKMYMIPNFLTVTFKHSAIQDGCSLALYTSAARTPPPTNPCQIYQGLLHLHLTLLTDLRTYLPQARCSYLMGSQGWSPLLVSLVTDESS